MFTIQEREQVQQYVLHLAGTDPRVVAGAVVGSLALGEGDRWSDLDLTFAVAGDASLADVLEDWTAKLVQKFDAAHLFDLPAGATIYRVFLLPGSLQFDLSFSPASSFGAAGPKFKLLFGSAITKPFGQLPPAHELFGYAVHHLLRARFCIERGRYWQAEYWISSARDYALMLACLRLGLPTAHGRGYDDLSSEVLDNFRESFVATPERQALMRALGQVIDGLFTQTEQVASLAKTVEPRVRELTTEFTTTAR